MVKRPFASAVTRETRAVAESVRTIVAEATAWSCSSTTPPSTRESRGCAAAGGGAASESRQQTQPASMRLRVALIWEEIRLRGPGNRDAPRAALEGHAALDLPARDVDDREVARRAVRGEEPRAV